MSCESQLTHQFNVEVLGTSFNVNAYKGKKQAEVVLVEGSVRLSGKYQKEVLMKPDNLVVVSEGRASRIKRVRAKDYTCLLYTSFAGKSPMGPRGDVILEADWCVSEFLKELDQLGLAENTIVVSVSYTHLLE